MCLDDNGDLRSRPAIPDPIYRLELPAWYSRSIQPAHVGKLDDRGAVASRPAELQSQPTVSSFIGTTWLHRTHIGGTGRQWADRLPSQHPQAFWSAHLSSSSFREVNLHVVALLDHGLKSGPPVLPLPSSRDAACDICTVRQSPFDGRPRPGWE